MVNVAMPMKFAVATCLYTAAASAESINFINKCTYPIELYHSQSGSAVSKETVIAIGSTYCSEISGTAHMFRHTSDVSSTLLEISLVGTIFYDISIIPPGPGFCSSYDECKGGHKTGFNVPMSVVPKTNVGVGSCSSLFCAADDPNTCADAYLFPMDNTKTHSCPLGTSLDVTFCHNSGDSNNYDNVSQTQQQDPVKQVLNPVVQQGLNPVVQQGLNPVVQQGASPTQPPPLLANSPDQNEYGSNDGGSHMSGQGPTNPGTVKIYSELGQVKSSYSYIGKFAGNVKGSFDAVVDLSTCTKEPVSLQSPVGPMSEAVTLIFRGPIEIAQISVFTNEKGNGSWERVSYYSREERKAENIVFMTNRNADFTGQNEHSPQCYASADGLSKAEEPTVFGGVLCDALEPTKIGAGPGYSTGAEINIMTGKKCDGKCPGSSGDNDHQGWGGGKKVFVTEVSMPQGASLNMPAVWMLNARVVHTNQYGCNCRGMGPVGGCGELDIAEVIETNLLHDKVSTHYYFYDGSTLSEGGDNFAPRPFASSTVYVTIIDDSNDGLIKIVELASFDFTLLNLDTIYKKLVDC